MLLELVTHTQTIIDPLWEINIAAEQGSWIQMRQARNTETRTSYQSPDRYYTSCRVLL